jgi:Zn-dependent protease
VLAFPMLVFAMCAHEYAHAVTALQQGDDTAYRLGRVTLNPLPHIDPWMSVLMPVMIWFLSNGSYTFGGAKPVPVNSSRFKNYVRGDLIVSAAGVITNLLLALVCSVIFVLLGLIAASLPSAGTVLDTAQRMMVHGIWLNLVLCFFNLIPVPPLDGGNVLLGLLPPRMAAAYDGLRNYGFLILYALLLTGTATALIWPPTLFVARILLP